MNTVEINTRNFKSILILIVTNIVFIFLVCQTAKFFISSYYWHKGTIYAMDSDWVSSIENYNQAVRFDPNNGRLRFFYGSMLLNAGRLDAGIYELEKATRNFKDIYLYQNLGKAYLEKKMINQSIYYYTKIIQTGMDYTINLNNLGVVYLNSCQWDRAIDIFEQVVSVDGEYAKAYENLGLAYLNKGAFEKAITKFEKALVLSPNKVNTLNNLGIAYMKSKRYDEAIITFKKILVVDRKNSICYNNIGNVFYLKGDRKKAMEYWKETLKIDPDNQIAKHNIERSLMKK